MSFRKWLRAMMFLVMAFLSFNAYGQNKVITGKVTDNNGVPVAGVSVTLKGASQGTVTGPDGVYSLSVPESATELVFSSIGYNESVVAIDGRSVVDQSLTGNAASLGEVVVVAYGTRKKGDLTGAVTSVAAKDFQKGNIPSPEQLLQGKVAGLQITSGGGYAGGGSRIRIRGGASLNSSNDPLIVIDGVPVEGNGISGSGNLLATINPNDIESMSVLKDASATALYGSRASNGVVIITTKKGAKGKLRFSFNNNISVGSVTKTVDVLSGDDVRSIVTQFADSTGQQTWKNLLGTENTNWQDHIFQDAVGNDHSLNVSGAVNSVPFRASVGFTNQNGILKTDNFKRITGSLNLTPKLFDNHLSVALSLKGAQTKNRFANAGAVGNALSFDPTKPVYADNKFGGYFEWEDANGNPNGLSNRNPLALLDLRDNRSTINRFIGNLNLDYKLHFFPDLHLQLNVGTDRTKGEGTDIVSELAATDFLTGGRISQYEQEKENNLVDAFLFYEKNIDAINGKVDVLVGHSYQEFITRNPNFASYSKSDPTEVIPGSEPTFPDDENSFALESYLGRVNLTLADKYLFTASLRRDASSKFSKSNRVGYFPAFAFAWKLKDEFFDNSEVVTDLKLRLGYGLTGQQDGIPYYSYLPYYSFSQGTAYYQLGDEFYELLRPSAYDINRRWESTTTYNAGLDYGFTHNRISGSVDVYFKKTKDLLSIVPEAPGANFDIQIVKNVGNMENKGMEFVLNTVPVLNKNIKWELGGNFTWQTTKITNLLEYQDETFKGINVSGISGGTGNNIGIHQLGLTPYTFYLNKQVYDPSGRPIERLYEDINRDGKTDDNDRYYYHSPMPSYLLGLNTQVTYKKLSLGLAGHGSFGNYLYNNYLSNSAVLNAIQNPVGFIGNAPVAYSDTRFVNNQYFSDYYIENASFFRLDNINLGFNAGKIFRKRDVKARFGINIQNVFVITKYSGLDPENSSDTGVDNTIYPRPRVFNFGVNLDF